MHMVAGLVVVLGAGIGLAKDDKKPMKLEGTYVIVGLEMAGEKLPAEFFDKASAEQRTIRITADKLIAMKDGKEDPITYKIDPSKTPAHITTTDIKGGKTETSFGIYKIDGDTLTICMIESDTSEDRPKEFKTRKGVKMVLMTLKRK